MKEQYIKMRNTKQVDLNLLYTYASSKGFTGSPSDFAFVMQFADISLILNKLDQEFNLTLLEDKNKNFVKVVE